jgi:hypothetical protein
MASCISVHVGRDNTIAGVDAAISDEPAAELTAADSWRARNLETRRGHHRIAAYLEHRPFR